MQREIHTKVMTCDQCGKTDEYQLKPVQYGGAPFSRWIKNVNNELDFCSPKCTELYFANWENKQKDRL